MEKEMINSNVAKSYVLEGLKLFLDIDNPYIIENTNHSYTLYYKKFRNGVIYNETMEISLRKFIEFLKFGMSINGGYDIWKIDAKEKDNEYFFKVYYNCFEVDKGFYR